MSVLSIQMEIPSRQLNINLSSEERSLDRDLEVARYLKSQHLRRKCRTKKKRAEDRSIHSLGI